MTASETDRLHLYEIARERWQDDDAARTLMNLLPPDLDRLATKDDLALMTAVLRTEMAGLRGDMRTEVSGLGGELRAEMGGMRGDLLELINQQTRTILLANVGMWLSVVGLIVGLRFS
ncbi:MAG: hypothetical protein ABI276_00435 [Acidimicrobiales bacterium]